MSQTPLLPLLLLLLSLAAASAAPLLVMDFIRHGARSPINKLPFFKNITWKEPGQLTPVGERQHYLLGRLRREQYIEGKIGKLLPETYDAAKIYVRTTNFNRTMTSAQSYLLGLYPFGLQALNELQISHRKDLLAPPVNLSIGLDLVDQLMEKPMPNSIPMHALHKVEDVAENLLLPNECQYIARATQQYGQKRYDTNIEKFASLWQALMAAYPSITMEYIKAGRNAVTLTDFLCCADAEGMRPYWITDAMIDGCKKFLSQYMKDDLSPNSQVIKIMVSGIVKEVLDAMNRTIEGRTTVKYALYGAHDSTLTIILLGLHEMNNTIAWTKLPFAGNVLFQMDDGADHPVSVLYNGQLIHSEPYQTFKKKFALVGDLGMTREAACSLPLTMLRRQNDP